MVEPPNRGEYDALTARVARVEGDMRDIRDDMRELKVMVARIDAQIPYLATKAEIAQLPTKTYMWGILGVLLTAYACGLAALAILK